MTASKNRLRTFARAMRTAPVTTEDRLWKALRDRRLAGLKFRRQVPIGSYIADFLCYRHRLIVEADGPLHDPDYDRRRDAWLSGQGFRVLRFKNEEIGQDCEAVVAAVLQAVGL